MRTTLFLPIEVSNGTILVDVTPVTLLGVMDAGEFIEAKTGITLGKKVPIVDVAKRLRNRDTSSKAQPRGCSTP